MRRPLALAALVLSVAAVLPVTQAAALPPECDRYGDRPCIVLCEIYHEYLAPLVEGLC